MLIFNDKPAVREGGNHMPANGSRSGDAFRLGGPEIPALTVGFFALSFRCG